MNAFDRLDKDDSGYLDPSEIEQLFDDVYDGQAPSFETEAFLEFFDANKDGKISREDFMILSKNSKKKKKKPVV